VQPEENGMTRILYRLLLRLHPREFRAEFAGEMLWIFDEAGRSLGALPLFADAVESLVRQWVVRSGAWPYAVGVMVNGALLTALFLGPELAGGARPNGLPAWAEPAPAPVHYRLYVWVEPSWNDSKQAAEQER
jgi:hypothetical protein